MSSTVDAASGVATDGVIEDSGHDHCWHPYSLMESRVVPLTYSEVCCKQWCAPSWLRLVLPVNADVLTQGLADYMAEHPIVVFRLQPQPVSQPVEPEQSTVDQGLATAPDLRVVPTS